MPFSSSHPALQRQLTIFRSGTTRGFKLLALTVADPNAGAITPTDCTIAMGTDSSLWKSNGTTWTLVGNASGGDIIPDNVNMQFGDSADAWANYKIVLATSGPSRTLRIQPVTSFTDAGTGGATPGVVIASDLTTVTSGTGPQTGAVSATSGNTRATVAGATTGDTGAATYGSGFTLASVAGATAGDTGAASFKSGDSTAVGGATSGDTGSTVYGSGDSTSGSSGSASLTSGDGGVASGNVNVQVGAAPSTGNLLLAVPAGGTSTGAIEAQVGSSIAMFKTTGFLPPAALGNTAQALGVIPQVLRFTVTTPGSIAVTMDYTGVIAFITVIKTTNGAPGDTFDLQTATGSALAAPYDMALGTAGLVGVIEAFNATAANRAFASGTAVTLVAAGTAGSVNVEVYVTTYRTA